MGLRISLTVNKWNTLELIIGTDVGVNDICLNKMKYNNIYYL